MDEDDLSLVRCFSQAYSYRASFARQEETVSWLLSPTQELPLVDNIIKK